MVHDSQVCVVCKCYMEWKLDLYQWWTILICSQYKLWASLRVPGDSLQTIQSPKRHVRIVRLWPQARVCWMRVEREIKRWGLIDGQWGMDNDLNSLNIPWPVAMLWCSPPFSLEFAWLAGCHQGLMKASYLTMNKEIFERLNITKTWRKKGEKGVTTILQWWSGWSEI